MWLSTPEQTYPALIHVPYLDHPIFNDVTEQVTKNNDFYTHVYTLEESNIFFHHFFENTVAKNSPEERKQFVYSSKGFTRSLFLTKNIWFSVSRYDTTPFTDEENAIFKRFANVFEQTYTRFLDLQKAEAQARESVIELSLERVRAKTMAMQKPSEFVDVINVIGEQFVHLGFDIEWVNFGANGLNITAGIDIWNFAVIPGGSPIAGRVFIPHFDHPVFTISVANLNEYLNGGKDFSVLTLDKHTKDTWLDHVYAQTIFKDVPYELRKIQYDKPGYTSSNIVLKDTWLSIGKFDIRSFSDEQHAIQRRLANAFGQAYTRFLDLQKAEVQARESQVQLALERVRARTMAMQKSDELLETSFLLFQQLKELGETAAQLSIGIIKEEEGYVEFSATFHGTQIPQSYKVPVDEPFVMKKILEAWKAKQKSLLLELKGEELKTYNNWRNSFLEKKIIFPEERWIINATFFSKGFLSFSSDQPRPKETLQLLERFAGVFDLTYTRFLDLKQAEAQAREAQIELHWKKCAPVL
jgi:hypothetical protein